MAPPNASLFSEPGGSEEGHMYMLYLLAARVGPGKRPAAAAAGELLSGACRPRLDCWGRQMTVRE